MMNNDEYCRLSGGGGDTNVYAYGGKACNMMTMDQHSYETTKYVRADGRDYYSATKVRLSVRRLQFNLQ